MLSAVKGLLNYKLVNCLLEQALAEETCASSIHDWHFKRRQERTGTMAVNDGSLKVCHGRFMYSIAQRDKS